MFNKRFMTSATKCLIHLALKDFFRLCVSHCLSV